MLTWTRDDGAWYGNGFRIERLSPGAWVLVDREWDDRGIVEDPTPIASLSSLAACKHKAERLHEERELSSLRKSLGMVAFGAGSMSLLFLSSPIVAIACGIVGAAAGLEIIMTWWDRATGSAREITQ